MRQAKQDPNRQPALASPAGDPARILTEAAPTQFTSSRSEAGSLQRRVVLGSGSGIELQYPERLVWPSPWIGHIPFAFWLVEALVPRVVVELGVQSGNSYCAFLQAIQFLALPAQCYGIDHWRGDEHSDHYGDNVYSELCSYHDPRYSTFSTLIRATFEEALPYFSDQSVDLLHIDGFHTYEAVAKDFADWLPKMSSRGLVLFHDINVREREFGVWRFWEEIAARYQTLAFVHSHGLGLAYVGSDPPPVSLRALLSMADPDGVNRIRSYFARLGMSLIDRYERRQAEGVAGRVRASEGEVEAAQAEIRRQLETTDALRSEVANARIEAATATAQAEVLQAELTTIRAEVAQQIGAAASLQQELSASRDETARQTEAAARLQQQCSEAASELARQTAAASMRETEAHKAARRIALLQSELESARAEIVRNTAAAGVRETDARETADRVARLNTELESARVEIARQREAADASCANAEKTSDQIAALEEEISRVRSQIGHAIAQRDRATQLLRQQITTTATLQRELTAVKSDLVRDADATIVVLQGELESARAEIGRQLEAAGVSCAEDQDMPQRVAALGAELARARTQISDAIAECEKATDGLRQELAASARLQSELLAVRPTEAVAALVNRLEKVKPMIPKLVKQYIKKRMLGPKP